MRKSIRFPRPGFSAIVAAVAFCALAIPGAYATPIGPVIQYFPITSDHCTGGCLGTLPNAGLITVTDNGIGTLDISVQLAAGWKIVNTGFDASFGFNLVGSIGSVTYSGITPGFDPVGGNPQTAGALHMDGTGFFTFGLDCTVPGVACTKSGGGGGTTGSLAFTIAAAGLDITDLTTNAAGQIFAVDVISAVTGNTGAVDASSGSPPQEIPEPSTLLLLCTGVGLVGVARRKSIANLLKK